MKTKLKQFRVQAGLTQAKVAEAVGVSQPNYQRWEASSAPIPEDPSEDLEDGLQERRHKKKHHQPRPSLPRTLSAPDLLTTLTSTPTHSHDLRNQPPMSNLAAPSHRVRGASHFDFKTSTSGIATKAMKNELSHLVASVQDPPTRKAFDTEMQSFFLLFTRYLAEKAQSKGL